VVELAGVNLENVTKYFGPVLAVSEFSLDIKDKEFIVLVGPSGCGKSTVLRMVAGLERATSGDIYIGNQLVIGFHQETETLRWYFKAMRSTLI